MTRDEVLAEFKAAGALLEGHFILSSGLRSPVFLQKAKVFADAERTATLCAALAEKVRATLDQSVDITRKAKCICHDLFAITGAAPGFQAEIC